MKTLKRLKKLEKIKRLKSSLEAYESVVVAFSGGVDSSFILKAAVDFLESENVLAVTALSEAYPDHERQDAKRLAKKLGVDWRTIKSSEIANSNFRRNPPNRCYFCKRGLFEDLKKIADRERINQVVDGTIRDDVNGHRPGAKAAEELNIASPLQEAKLTKDEVRKYSKQIGLETWNKPSFACLASRFPYGEEITEEKFTTVEQAEESLQMLGMEQFRVRHHDGIARIEVRKADFERVISARDRIVSHLKELGYDYVTLDLEGYRTGSMDETLLKKTNGE